MPSACLCISQQSLTLPLLMMNLPQKKDTDRVGYSFRCSLIDLKAWIHWYYPLMSIPMVYYSSGSLGLYYLTIIGQSWVFELSKASKYLNSSCLAYSLAPYVYLTDYNLRRVSRSWARDEKKFKTIKVEANISFVGMSIMACSFSPIVSSLSSCLSSCLTYFYSTCYSSFSIRLLYK